MKKLTIWSSNFFFYNFSLFLYRSDHDFSFSFFVPFLCSVWWLLEQWIWQHLWSDSFNETPWAAGYSRKSHCDYFHRVFILLGISWKTKRFLISLLLINSSGNSYVELEQQWPPFNFSQGSELWSGDYTITSYNRILLEEKCNQSTFSLKEAIISLSKYQPSHMKTFIRPFHMNSPLCWQPLLYFDQHLIMNHPAQYEFNITPSIHTFIWLSEPVHHIQFWCLCSCCWCYWWCSKSGVKLWFVRQFAEGNQRNDREHLETKRNRGRANEKNSNFLLYWCD